MRHVILFRERRDHEKRHPVAGVGKVADRTCSLCTDIARVEIHGLDAVWAHGWLWCNMVVQATILIVCEYENRVLPRWALHQGINDRGYVIRTQLDIRCLPVVAGGMLVQTGGSCRLNNGNLRQGVVLQVRKVLRHRREVLRVLRWNALAKDKRLNVGLL